MSNLGTTTVQLSTIIGNSSSSGSAIATGNTNVTFAGTILGPQTTGGGCNPANGTIGTDAGYNLDSDGTCLNLPTPAEGSHLGSETLGTATYAEALDAYLADTPALNGARSKTFALLNTPFPATTAPNPAYDVIPAGFALPVAAGGATTACAAADQRGTVAVAGAKCAIGAYRLQPTTTAVTVSPDATVAGTTETYTATITPAATGGTVAFDDGAGGAATSACAAQPVTNGVATCTVTYGTAGDLQVTARYSGDGAGNSFVASASPARSVTVAPMPVVPEPPVTPDTTAPTSRISKISTAKQPITVRGTASDAGGVGRVRISLARKAGARCRFLRANRTFGAPRSCKRTLYVTATGTSSWRLRLPKLSAGQYVVWSRAIDSAGNVERKSSSRNLRRLRIG